MDYCCYWLLSDKIMPLSPLRDSYPGFTITFAIIPPCTRAHFKPACSKTTVCNTTSLGHGHISSPCLPAPSSCALKFFRLPVGFVLLILWLVQASSLGRCLPSFVLRLMPSTARILLSFRLRGKHTILSSPSPIIHLYADNAPPFSS